MKNNLELISRITSIAADANGIRAGSDPIIRTLVGEVGGVFGFICIENADDGTIEVSAASGMEAADFRRLEARVGSSSVSAVIANSSAMTIPIENDAALDFLKKAHGSVDIASVPIFVNRRAAGSISTISFESARPTMGAPTSSVAKVAPDPGVSSGSLQSALTGSGSANHTVRQRAHRT